MIGIAIQMGWLVSLGIVEVFAPQWSAHETQQHTRRLRNVAFTLINHVAIPPLSVGLLAVIHHTHSGLARELPMWVGLPLAIVVFDFIGYWFHRVSHRNLFLWRFHQIHHLDEDFDFTTGARVHFVEEGLHQALLILAAAALGFPPLYLTIFATASFVMALAHHANIAIPDRVERRLRLVIFTPQLHVPHHHDQIANTDTNFGFIFPWWDRMFGTYNDRRRTPLWRIGLDYSRDLSLVRLLVEPFRRTHLKDSPRAATPAQQIPASSRSES